MGSKTIYWHRDLPPFDAVPMGEHCVEATSFRVSGMLAHRDELWDRCYNDLTVQAQNRLYQEVTRLGGQYAHVFDESIDSRHDDRAGENWLHGRYTFVLYRRPQPADGREAAECDASEESSEDRGSPRGLADG